MRLPAEVGFNLYIGLDPRLLTNLSKKKLRNRIYDLCLKPEDYQLHDIYTHKDGKVLSRRTNQPRRLATQLLYLNQQIHRETRAYVYDLNISFTNFEAFESFAHKIGPTISRCWTRSTSSN